MILSARLASSNHYFYLNIVLFYSILKSGPMGTTCVNSEQALMVIWPSGSILGGKLPISFDLPKLG